MESNEFVLSDVLLYLKERDRVLPVSGQNIREYPVVLSRFMFRDPTLDEECNSDAVGYESFLDSDGDLILPRRQQNYPEIIYLEHTMETHLPDVGLQIWPGCMMLCDFILSNQTTFAAKIVVELGAGVGLASLTAARFAKRIIATDLNDDALKLCSRNAALNMNLLSEINSTGQQLQSSKIEVQKLNWLDATTFYCHDFDDVHNAFVDLSCERQLTDETASAFLADLLEADILVASDVIYDDDATDAFFQIIYEIMLKSKSCKVLYLSVEKRLNFTLEDLDVACPAYDHFSDCLSYLCSLTGLRGQQFAAEIVTNIPQSFDYHRSPYLELWKISLQNATGSAAYMDIV